MPGSAMQRRLLVVDPCDDCQRLLPVLASAGWTVRSSTLDAAMQQACDIGVLRLQASHLQQRQAIEDLIARSDTEWIAVLSVQELRLQDVGDFVSEWFFDFHTLPLDLSRVQVTLARAYGMARLRGRPVLPAAPTEHELLGDSRPVRELRQLLAELAPTEATVLIRGESGTGKELVARLLHRQSPRHDQPFVVMNCAAQPPQAVAGLLAAAQGGTLFIDELCDLSLEAQAELLRALEGRALGMPGSPADIRVLAATQLDPAQGRMSEALRHRLDAVAVVIAPLRERHGDLAILANHFARFYSRQTGRRPRAFSDEALAAMGRHDWPGNVRELAIRVRRGLVLAEGRHIGAQDLGLPALDEAHAPLGTLEDYKHRAERQALCDVLNRHSDNMSIAAKVLGISRPTFYRLLHKHRIR
ncbi:sigma-54-dependent Fis family transcriptional regulator [Pseudomonas sp. S75]|uniref:sigma-54-dependent transcriptional regulator n=1 Tax=unclassified Pseudomonas TaxID=196821 RepID=UPI001903C119|nr:MULTISPECIES: sigma-54 dependent transcriptional regulator [unclassified Pseudomonas]MBJ9973817.1 sigma-54-dependent Fis family transcriptional regulator [Pseudomonas sp. S30]MBK0152253.1 sigma-54-dependent Fis family transcriptional regulator [Pseudomonas sp. S75]